MPFPLKREEKRKHLEKALEAIVEELFAKSFYGEIMVLI